MALQDAIEAVQDLAGAVEGIRAAPTTLPDSINVFPFLVCYAGSGSFEYSPAGVMKGLHNIILELHVARKDLPRDVTKAMEFSDSIPKAIMADPTLNATVSTIGRISYTFGLMGYGSTETIGFRFTLENVKLQTVI